RPVAAPSRGVRERRRERVPDDVRAVRVRSPATGGRVDLRGEVERRGLAAVQTTDLPLDERAVAAARDDALPVARARHVARGPEDARRALRRDEGGGRHGETRREAVEDDRVVQRGPAAGVAGREAELD